MAVMNTMPNPPATALPTSHEDVLGVVLAGGLARRLGGDKALVTLAGRTLLDRALDRLEGQVGGLLVNANGDAERFGPSHLPVIADTVAGHPGPLAGVLAAMDHAAETGWRWIVTVPVDAPFMPLDLVDSLIVALRAGGAEIACVASGGRVHPVTALWPVAIREDLRRALVEEGVRKVDTFSMGRNRALADWSVEPADPFANVNTPHDLALAERRLSGN